MCITLGPAELKNTIVFSHRMQSGMHVLGYENKASSGPKASWGGRTRGIQADSPPSVNAMIIPIPAKNDLGPESAIDLTSDKTVLKDYVKALTPRNEMKGLSRGLELGLLNKGVSVFKTGSYEVVMASQPRLIPQVVKELHPEVKVDENLMEAYGSWYRGWHVAVCFWKGEVEPEPIMFTYEPKFPNHLFAPTLDAHTGGLPKPFTSLDHTIVFGSHEEAGVHVNRKTSEHLKPYLPDHVVGFAADFYVPNGDFWFPLSYRGLKLEWTASVTMRLPAGTMPV